MTAQGGLWESMSPQRQAALAGMLRRGADGKRDEVAIRTLLDEEPGPGNAQLMHDVATIIVTLPEEFEPETAAKAPAALERVLSGPTTGPGETVIRALVVTPVADGGQTEEK